MFKIVFVVVSLIVGNVDLCSEQLISTILYKKKQQEISYSDYDLYRIIKSLFVDMILLLFYKQ